jgi:hypothetical protein
VSNELQIPPGVFCVTSHGVVRSETFQALWEMRSHSESVGLRNVGWAMVPGALVDKARNDSVRMMLSAFGGQAQWICFCDADMVPPKGALHQILSTAYGTHPHFDCLSGLCNLRGDLALPTIDTGTGTWESWYPHSGVVEVIRTGAAFLLCKRHVFDRLPAPWFRLRVPARPADFMAEVDNWARIKLNGSNPFHNLPGRPWERLMELASSDPSSQPGAFVPAEVGEDSGFCDRVKNAGMRIAVDTSIEVGHLDTVVVASAQHKKKMREIETQWLQAVGVG